MLFSHLLPLGFMLGQALAKDKDESTSSSSDIIVLSGSKTESSASVPTGSYLSYSSTITVDTTSTDASSATGTQTGTTSSGTGSSDSLSSTITVTSSSKTVTLLVGSGTTSTITSSLNGTAASNSTATSTSTSSSASATNTTPCNNYAEFCNRKYSNLTQVSAHNSPFIRSGNAAANQYLSTTTQLNDGVRLVQGQVHRVNGTLRLCHTSCDILDVGPLVDWLTDIKTWVDSHPYDVVTILIGNGDYNWVENFTQPLESSGLTKYTYEPPKIPMGKDDWPTLASMILTGQRVVVFMDYMADQSKVPYILDEFSQMWETPFDPTDRNFPCTIQRPPNFNNSKALDYLSLMNHNLNTDISLLGTSLSVPTTTLLNVTNNVTGYGSLGSSTQQCDTMWGAPPNWLNVDYYNVGNGTVFEVAAKWNNVTYNRACCGVATSGSDRLAVVGRSVCMTAALVVFATWLLA